MKLLVQLWIAISLINVGAMATAVAAPRFIPVLVAETFSRGRPEPASVLRVGFGIRSIVDLPVTNLGVEAELLYANETTPFANDNSLRETMYRGRAGLNYRFFLIDPLTLNVRGGYQYNVVDDTYSVKASYREEKNSYKHATAYGGLECELNPISGFGVMLGATLSEHRVINKWIVQYYIGIVLR